MVVHMQRHTMFLWVSGLLLADWGQVARAAQRHADRCTLWTFKCRPVVAIPCWVLIVVTELADALVALPHCHQVFHVSGVFSKSLSCSTCCVELPTRGVPHVVAGLASSFWGLPLTLGSRWVVMAWTSCGHQRGCGANGESYRLCEEWVDGGEKSKIIVNELQVLRLIQRPHLVGLPQPGPPLHD